MSGRGKGGKVLAISFSSSQTVVDFVFLRRVSERVVPSVIVRSFGTTFKVRRELVWPATPSYTLSRYHQAGHSSPRTSWWCEAYLGLDLRGDSWCPQDIPRECETFVFAVVVFFLILL